MDSLISADGTRIAFEWAGQGHPVIFAPGAFNDHTTCADLARALASDHTVVTYDRRARGRSGDTLPYAIDREIEDLDALIRHVGGSAAVFGFSSGGVLALAAAEAGLGISHLVLYEVPFAYTRPALSPDMPGRLARLVANGHPGDAVAVFQAEVIGLPPEVIEGARQSPMWPGLEAMAQSLVYETTITSTYPTPSPAMKALPTPTLILNGERTWPFLREASEHLARDLPASVHREVAGGANHGIPAEPTAEAIREFLG